MTNLILNNLYVKYMQDYLKKKIIGCFVQKVQMIDNTQDYLRIRYRKTDVKGNIIIGQGYIIDTKYETEARSENKGFSLILNKNLENKRVENVWQYNMEKIIVIEFADFYLIVELFSTKNMILCDKNYKIISCLYNEEWKDRVVKVKENYTFPPSGAKNIVDTETEPNYNIEKNMVSSLVTEYNISPSIVEKLVEINNFDKVKYSNNDLNKLFLDLREIYRSDTTNQSYYVLNNKDKSEYLPIISNKNIGDLIKSSLNSDLDDIIIKNLSRHDELQKISVKNKEESRVIAIIKEQDRKLKRLEEEIKLEKIKGNAIYQYYSEIEEIVKIIQIAQKKGISYEQIGQTLDKSKANIKKLDIFKEIRSKDKVVLFTLPLQS